MPFIPHTDEDIKEMLSALEVESIATLFNDIPDSLKKINLSHLPPALNELGLNRLMKERASENHVGLNFIGAGAYEHHIPAAVWDIASRGEFMTSYTPYQAEASQGTLQILFEYQTMMTRLMETDVSNASLYDGASALAEACLMAIRCSSKNSVTPHIVIPKTVHPFYRQVVNTIVGQQSDILLTEMEYDDRSGLITVEMLEKISTPITALIIPQPNFFGLIEDVDQLVDWIHKKNGLAIALVNPLAMSLLKPPGLWGEQGADLICGEGQPLGIPLSYGGPYYGFLCCKKKFIRQLPGRLVAKTVDQTGTTGFVLTLQAREQHIRRAKATSNICTNQGLMVTASTIYMSLLGVKGLQHTALDCFKKTSFLKKQLSALPNVKCFFESLHFHELVVCLNKPVEPILKKLAQLGIQGGFSLEKYYPELGHSFLTCVTETKTKEEIELFCNKLAEVLGC